MPEHVVYECTDAIYLKVYMTLASADYKSLNFYEEKTFAFFFFFFFGECGPHIENERNVCVDCSSNGNGMRNKGMWSNYGN